MLWRRWISILCSWRMATSGHVRSNVAGKLCYMHTFVIPVDLTRSMEAAIKTARIEQQEPDPPEDRIKSQGIVLDFVASIDPKLWKLSGVFVGALTVFYEMKNKARSWFEDRKWLEQDWRKVKSNVDLFGYKRETIGLWLDAVYDRHQTLANEVMSKFASSSLGSEFLTPTGKGHINFANIVGGVCRGWLNDSPVDFCLVFLAGVVEQSYVVSSLTTAVGYPMTPTASICSTKFIFQPVNLKGNRWGIFIVRLQNVEATSKLQVYVYMYEPLIDEEYRDDMEIIWNGITSDEGEIVQEGLRGFVERWHRNSAPSSKLVIDPIEWVEAPQQLDYASCGVLVVAQAYSYLTGNVQWQESNVSKDDVKVMRLRMLWIIMCESHERCMSRYTVDKTRDIHQKLLDQLK